MHEYINGKLPVAIEELFTRTQDIRTYNTRQQQNPHVLRRRTQAAAAFHKVNTRHTFAKKCQKIFLDRLMSGYQ